MANTLLTIDQITREALRVLHQKLNFIGNCNRGYDDSFAKSGAKIGDSLRIRLPNEFTVRTGKSVSTQDTTESSVTLQVATQKGVDISYFSDEMALDLDDFSKRIIEPAMARLAANIEADAFNMIEDVPYHVDNLGSAITFKKVLEGRKVLQDNLAPEDDNRCVILNTQDNVDLVDALKGLFHDSKEISKQYKKGLMGRTAGFDFYENTLIPAHTTGTAAASTGYLVNGATQTGTSLTVDTGTTTFLEGDIITIAGVNSVHPESKTDTGNLQQFVVTADSGASATSLSIYPGITTSGAKQNCSASPADNAAITKIGAASDVYYESLAFHKDAFCFATADLPLPGDTHKAAREVYDGLSMRCITGYDISTDAFITRLDILYGYKTIRPELACRILSN